MKKTIIFNVILLVLITYSVCTTANANENIGQQQEVILKRQVVSKDPHVVVHIFLVGNQEIARQKFRIDMESHRRMMEQLIASNDIEGLEELSVKQPEIVLIESNGEIPDGIVQEFHPSGQLAATHNYLNNKMEGKSKIFYPNGQLMQVSLFKHGVLREVKQYDENGSLTKEASYSEDGQIISSETNNIP